MYVGTFHVGIGEEWLWVDEIRGFISYHPESSEFWCIHLDSTGVGIGMCVPHGEVSVMP